MPNHPQGQAVQTPPGEQLPPFGPFRVLLAQFSVTEGAEISGSMMVNVNGVDMLNQQFSSIPARGAMALLLLSAMVIPGRRRVRFER